MSSLQLQQIKKQYGAVDIVRGVELDVQPGEFLVLVGPSGCGKSTVLRMIAGLEEISEGRLLIDGRDVTHAEPSQRGVAMVFQSYALYPHMTVYQNMAFGLSLGRAGQQQVSDRVRKAADILQLSLLLDRLPKQLSGGQRQRVAIGRAIVRQPKVFLFDEPLSNLDAALRVQMRLELGRLHDELKATMVYVTHDQVEAMTLADRIAVLNEGRIEQVGAPLDLYQRPATLFVARFIGSPKMNVLDAWQLPQTAATFTGAAAGAVAHLGIRPEHVQLVEPGAAALHGTVAVAEQLGNESFLYVDIGPAFPDLLVVRTPAGATPRPGEAVGLRFPADALHGFGPDGRRLDDSAAVGGSAP